MESRFSMIKLYKQVYRKYLQAFAAFCFISATCPAPTDASIVFNIDIDFPDSQKENTCKSQTHQYVSYH